MKRESTRKNTIRRKLRSDAGASITFALLIFLVCAVISAAVLVAATAAAGRMAGLAETDQKYYSVTSAAEVIKDMMDDQCISTFTRGDTTYKFNSAMNLIDDAALEDYVAPADTLPVVLATTTYPAKVTINAGGTTVYADVTKTDDNEVCFSVHDQETPSGNSYILKLYFAEDTNTTSDPPITKDEDDPLSNVKEVSWHFSSMINGYDYEN